jgi:hypothetical protein
MKTIRFWHYHNPNDGPVLIKLRAGQELSHTYAWNNGEGWSRESNYWSFDGQTLSVTVSRSGRDCDGWHEWNQESHCDATQAQSGPAYDGVTYPEWCNGLTSQRDQYAESMGY